MVRMATDVYRFDRVGALLSEPALDCATGPDAASVACNSRSASAAMPASQRAGSWSESAT